MGVMCDLNASRISRVSAPSLVSSRLVSSSANRLANVPIVDCPLQERFRCRQPFAENYLIALPIGSAPQPHALFTTRHDFPNFSSLLLIRSFWNATFSSSIFGFHPVHFFFHLHASQNKSGSGPSNPVLFIIVDVSRPISTLGNVIELCFSPFLFFTKLL